MRVIRIEEENAVVSQFESAKDTVQVVTETAATHVGRIATIITGAVRDVAREIGNWGTEVIEMREAARRAAADEARIDSDLPSWPTAKPTDG